MPAHVLIDRKRWQNRPDDAPVMKQSWRNLLFVHYRMDPNVIQSLLPRGLTVDTYDGAAWIGIVPFYMRAIRPVWSPVVPYVSNFLELNVRTYAVNDDGVPGVWFLSLAANRWLAVHLARQLFRLPYHWSSMSATEQADGTIDYRCRRFTDDQKRGFEFRWQPTGSPSSAIDNTLEFFLVERYILFAKLSNGAIATGQVHHVPYTVQTVDIKKVSPEILSLDGLDVPRSAPDHALYSPGVDVDVFGLKKPR